MRVGKRIRLNTIVYEAQEIKNQVRHLSPIAAKAPSKLFSCLQQCLKWLAGSSEKGNALHWLPHICKCLQVWQSKPIVQIAKEFNPFLNIMMSSALSESSETFLLFLIWYSEKVWLPLLKALIADSQLNPAIYNQCGTRLPRPRTHSYASDFQ